MAISDVPESAGTTTTVRSDSDLNGSSLLRRRHSATTAGAESSAEDVVRDLGSNDSLNGKSSEGDKDHHKLEHAAANNAIHNDTADRGQVTDVKFAYRPSVPAHRKIKESPLSSDNIFRQSHAGLFNLCIVVLVAVNSRLIIENLMKYGWLIKSGFWFSSKSLRDWPLFMCCLSLAIFPLAAFIVEKLAQQKCISEPVVVLLHIIITTGAFFYPVLVILRCDSAFLSGVTLMLFTCIVWLKLVSYAHTNYDMRELAISNEKGETLPNTLNMEYPYIVSFKSLAYFMVAPTLCYQCIKGTVIWTYLQLYLWCGMCLRILVRGPQSVTIEKQSKPSYPRTPSIRKGWVFRQLVKLIIFTGVMGFIIEQYMNPIVRNSQHPLKGNLLYAIERVLKLSVPNVYVWLCMFYCFFHLWLNILAELLRFGDREFYKDWWNAKTVEEYWRMWNMPVHKWMVRHIYFPCIRNGIHKGAAALISFLVSAVFHELCIAIPCHMFKLWAFIGIMFQVPLVLITNYLQNKYRNSMVGNMIFWFIFCIFGQPMCVLLYYHDLMNRKGNLD